MDNELPAEVVLRIQKDATAYANKTFSGRNSISIHAARRGHYTEVATEYAIRLHQADQEITRLKQWKSEADALLKPILEYGQSKEAGIPLGKSITVVVLERCKELDKAVDLLHESLVHIEYLENKFNCVTGSGNNFKSRLTTFLDGK